ncbi:hypothetical protein A1F96_09601 [Pyrenophora tritici-repentis]|nr:hypothetical protein PtrSN001A_009627 [Pyrenophora tritici-repentis]KAI1527901.1 hypothetical protein PtrSN001C_009681 [Pyrenophora tritici-repentis]KAI1562812.1 hypothetical protein PtrEW4_009769 [Pyrenophora tritici-repentis]KAI1596466.1 hypothetical protein PtrCC142_009621 [Pyrenophora tritici-repentis]PWO21373.1 PrfA, Protein chain release factor A [Pyrenophora tritici-repentis]
MKISQSCTVLAILAFTHATPVPADNPQSLALLPRSDSGSTDVIVHEATHSSTLEKRTIEGSTTGYTPITNVKKTLTLAAGEVVFEITRLTGTGSDDLPGAPGGDIFAKGVNGQASAYEDITIAGNHNLKMEFKSNY